MDKILKKATKIKTLEIPEDKIKLVEIEEFNGVQGEIFKFEDKLLTKTKDGWIMAKIEEKEDLHTTNKNLEKEIIEIKEWCKNLKNYFDFKLEEIRKTQQQIVKNQADMLETTKKYVDSKLKKEG